MPTSRHFGFGSAAYALCGIIVILLAVIVFQCVRRPAGQGAVSSLGAQVKTVIEGGQTLLVVNGVALPLPNDAPSGERPMFAAVGLTPACDLDGSRLCPIYVLSRSMATPHPQSYYAPVRMWPVDFLGMTPEAWASSQQAVADYSIMGPGDDAVRTNAQGVTVRKLATDEQMGEGSYLLLTRPGRTNGVMLFVTDGLGQTMANGARAY